MEFYDYFANHQFVCFMDSVLIYVSILHLWNTNSNFEFPLSRFGYILHLWNTNSNHKFSVLGMPVFDVVTQI